MNWRSVAEIALIIIGGIVVLTLTKKTVPVTIVPTKGDAPTSESEPAAEVSSAPFYMTVNQTYGSNMTIAPAASGSSGSSPTVVSSSTAQDAAMNSIVDTVWANYSSAVH